MATIDIFKKAVIDKYYELKSQGQLPTLLESAAPGDLRNYCRIRLSQGLSSYDIKVLKEFFDPIGKYPDLEKAIEKIEIDRLRPLQYFIKKNTKNPKENVVKLLAVLIDFHPRPFRISDWEEKRPEDLEDEQEESITTAKTDIEQTIPQSVDHPIEHQQQEDVKSTESTTESRTVEKRKQSIIYALGATLLGVGTLWGIHSRMAEQCMHWKVEHYIAISCQSSESNINTIALNEDVLNTFRKITRPDTLTLKHERKVWYSKIDNKVEFFTTMGLGFHPEYQSKGLKPATITILGKYAGENAKTNYDTKKEIQ